MFQSAFAGRLKIAPNLAIPVKIAQLIGSCSEPNSVSSSGGTHALLLARGRGIGRRHNSVLRHLLRCLDRLRGLSNQEKPAPHHGGSHERGLCVVAGFAAGIVTFLLVLFIGRRKRDPNQNLAESGKDQPHSR